MIAQNAAPGAFFTRLCDFYHNSEALSDAEAEAFRKMALSAEAFIAFGESPVAEKLRAFRAALRPDEPFLLARYNATSNLSRFGGMSEVPSLKEVPYPFRSEWGEQNKPGGQAKRDEEEPAAESDEETERKIEEEEAAKREKEEAVLPSSAL